MSPSHIGLATLIAVLWGLNFIVSKIGVSLMPPMFFAAWRFAVVVLLLLPWLKPLRGQMGRLVWISLTCGALNFGFTLLGLSMTDNVGPVAVTLQVNVPFMLLLAVFFLNEKIGPLRLIGMLMSFAGVVVVSFDPIAFQDPWAVAAVVVGGCSFGVSVILMRRLDGGHPMQVQAWIATISLPFLMAASLITESGQLESFVSFDTIAIATILYASIGATIIGHGGMFYLLQRYPVTYMVPTMIAPPIIAVFLGIVINNEPMTWKIALGGLMTFGGVSIIQIREALKVKDSKPGEAGV